MSASNTLNQLFKIIQVYNLSPHQFQDPLHQLDFIWKHIDQR